MLLIKGQHKGLKTDAKLGSHDTALAPNEPRPLNDSQLTSLLPLLPQVKLYFMIPPISKMDGAALSTLKKCE